MKVLVFDTETTGLIEFPIPRYRESEKWPYIVQFSYIIYDKGEITKIVDEIIKLPDGIEIPQKCVDIHHITTEMSRTKGKNV